MFIYFCSFTAYEFVFNLIWGHLHWIGNYIASNKRISCLGGKVLHGKGGLFMDVMYANLKTSIICFVLWVQVSAWVMLLAPKWAIYQLIQWRLCRNTLSWIFVVLAHWSNSKRVGMWLHLDILSWLRANQYMLLYRYAMCLEEKHLDQT
jgi:hypothetical protein